MILISSQFAMIVIWIVVVAIAWVEGDDWLAYVSAGDYHQVGAATAKHTVKVVPESFVHHPMWWMIGLTQAVGHVGHPEDVKEFVRRTVKYNKSLFLIVEDNANIFCFFRMRLVSSIIQII